MQLYLPNAWQQPGIIAPFARDVRLKLRVMSGARPSFLCPHSESTDAIQELEQLMQCAKTTLVPGSEERLTQDVPSIPTLPATPALRIH